MADTGTGSSGNRTSFNIPKIKKNTFKDNIQPVDINNRDVQNLLRDIHKNCLDINFCKELHVLEVCMVHNAELQSRYIKKRTEMKDEGRSAQTLSDQFGFRCHKPAEKLQVAKEGLTASRQTYNRLGKGECGVYLCRYFDVEVKNVWLSTNETEPLEVFVFKYFLGKCKPLNIGNIYSHSSSLEPTPNYDSHVSNVPPKPTDSPFAQKAKSGIYLYEYTEDCEPSKHPRQCLPFAIIKFKKKKQPAKTVEQARPPKEVSSAPGTSVTKAPLSASEKSTALPGTGNPQSLPSLLSVTSAVPTASTSGSKSSLSAASTALPQQSGKAVPTKIDKVSIAPDNLNPHKEAFTGRPEMPRKTLGKDGGKNHHRSAKGRGEAKFSDDEDAEAESEESSGGQSGAKSAMDSLLERQRLYLQRLDMANARVREQEHSKAMESIKQLPSVVPLQPLLQQPLNILPRDLNPVRNSREVVGASVPRIELADPKMSLSSSDDPSIKTSYSQLTAQSVSDPRLSNDIQRVQTSQTAPHDPRLARSISYESHKAPKASAVLNNPSISPSPRLDPRLQKRSISLNSTSDQAAAHNARENMSAGSSATSTAKSAFKISSAYPGSALKHPGSNKCDMKKKMSYSDYKKLKIKDQLSPSNSPAKQTETSPEKGLAGLKPSDHTEQVHQSPLSSATSTATQPIVTNPVTRTVHDTSGDMRVPLPTFYKEYDPDDDISPFLSDLDSWDTFSPHASDRDEETLHQQDCMSEFQSPVHDKPRSDPWSACRVNDKFQMPIKSPVKANSSTEGFQSAVKANSLPQKPSPLTAVNDKPSNSRMSQSSNRHTALLPLPVINEDGTVTNVLRGFVDGAVREIQMASTNSHTPVKESKPSDSVYYRPERLKLIKQVDQSESIKERSITVDSDSEVRALETHPKSGDSASYRLERLKVSERIDQTEDSDKEIRAVETPKASSCVPQSDLETPSTQEFTEPSTNTAPTTAGKLLFPNSVKTTSESLIHNLTRGSSAVYQNVSKQTVTVSALGETSNSSRDLPKENITDVGSPSNSSSSLPVEESPQPQTAVDRKSVDNLLKAFQKGLAMKRAKEIYSCEDSEKGVDTLDDKPQSETISEEAVYMEADSETPALEIDEEDINGTNNNKSDNTPCVNRASKVMKAPPLPLIPFLISEDEDSDHGTKTLKDSHCKNQSNSLGPSADERDEITHNKLTTLDSSLHTIFTSNSVSITPAPCGKSRVNEGDYSASSKLTIVDTILHASLTSKSSCAGRDKPVMDSSLEKKESTDITLAHSAAPEPETSNQPAVDIPPMSTKDTLRESTDPETSGLITVSCETELKSLGSKALGQVTSNIDQPTADTLLLSSRGSLQESTDWETIGHAIKSCETEKESSEITNNSAKTKLRDAQAVNLEGNVVQDDPRPLPKSLSMKELGIRCYLLALGDMNYQPSIILVDYVQAMENCQLEHECEICKESLQRYQLELDSGLKISTSYVLPESDTEDTGLETRAADQLDNGDSSEIENSSAGETESEHYIDDDSQIPASENPCLYTEQVTREKDIIVSKESCRSVSVGVDACTVAPKKTDSATIHDKISADNLLETDDKIGTYRQSNETSVEVEKTQSISGSSSKSDKITSSPDILRSNSESQRDANKRNMEELNSGELNIQQSKRFDLGRGKHTSVKSMPPLDVNPSAQNLERFKILKHLHSTIQKLRKESESSTAISNSIEGDAEADMSDSESSSTGHDFSIAASPNLIISESHSETNVCTNYVNEPKADNEKESPSIKPNIDQGEVVSSRHEMIKSLMNVKKDIPSNSGEKISDIRADQRISQGISLNRKSRENVPSVTSFTPPRTSVLLKPSPKSAMDAVMSPTIGQGANESRSSCSLDTSDEEKLREHFLEKTFEKNQGTGKKSVKKDPLIKNISKLERLKEVTANLMQIQNAEMISVKPPASKPAVTGELPKQYHARRKSPVPERRRAGRIDSERRSLRSRSRSRSRSTSRSPSRHKGKSRHSRDRQYPRREEVSRLSARRQSLETRPREFDKVISKEHSEDAVYVKDSLSVKSRGRRRSTHTPESSSCRDSSDDHKTWSQTYDKISSKGHSEGTDYVKDSLSVKSRSRRHSALILGSSSCHDSSDEHKTCPQTYDKITSKRHNEGTGHLKDLLSVKSRGRRHSAHIPGSSSVSSSSHTTAHTAALKFSAEAHEEGRREITEAESLPESKLKTSKTNDFEVETQVPNHHERQGMTPAELCEPMQEQLPSSSVATAYRRVSKLQSNLHHEKQGVTVSDISRQTVSKQLSEMDVSVIPLSPSPVINAKQRVSELESNPNHDKQEATSSDISETIVGKLVLDVPVSAVSLSLSPVITTEQKVIAFESNIPRDKHGVTTSDISESTGGKQLSDVNVSAVMFLPSPMVSTEWKISKQESKDAQRNDSDIVVEESGMQHSKIQQERQDSTKEKHQAAAGNSIPISEQKLPHNNSSKETYLVESTETTTVKGTDLNPTANLSIHSKAVSSADRVDKTSRPTSMIPRCIAKAIVRKTNSAPAETIRMPVMQPSTGKKHTSDVQTENHRKVAAQDKSLSASKPAVVQISKETEDRSIVKENDDARTKPTSKQNASARQNAMAVSDILSAFLTSESSRSAEDDVESSTSVSDSKAEVKPTNDDTNPGVKMFLEKVKEKSEVRKHLDDELLSFQLEIESLAAATADVDQDSYWGTPAHVTAGVDSPSFSISSDTNFGSKGQGEECGSGKGGTVVSGKSATSVSISQSKWIPLLPQDEWALPKPQGVTGTSDSVCKESDATPVSLPQSRLIPLLSQDEGTLSKPHGVGDNSDSIIKKSTAPVSLPQSKLIPSLPQDGGTLPKHLNAVDNSESTGKESSTTQICLNQNKWIPLPSQVDGSQPKSQNAADNSNLTQKESCIPEVSQPKPSQLSGLQELYIDTSLGEEKSSDIHKGASGGAGTCGNDTGSVMSAATGNKSDCSTDMQSREHLDMKSTATLYSPSNPTAVENQTFPELDKDVGQKTSQKPEDVALPPGRSFGQERAPEPHLGSTVCEELDYGDVDYRIGIPVNQHFPPAFEQIGNNNLQQPFGQRLPRNGPVPRLAIPNPFFSGPRAGPPRFSHSSTVSTNFNTNTGAPPFNPRGTGSALFNLPGYEVLRDTVSVLLHRSTVAAPAAPFRSHSNATSSFSAESPQWATASATFNQQDVSAYFSRSTISTPFCPSNGSTRPLPWGAPVLASFSSPAGQMPFGDQDYRQLPQRSQPQLFLSPSSTGYNRSSFDGQRNLLDQCSQPSMSLESKRDIPVWAQGACVNSKPGSNCVQAVNDSADASVQDDGINNSKKSLELAEKMQKGEKVQKGAELDHNKQRGSESILSVKRGGNFHPDRGRQEDSLSTSKMEDPSSFWVSGGGSESSEIPGLDFITSGNPKPTSHNQTVQKESMPQDSHLSTSMASSPEHIQNATFIREEQEKAKASTFDPQSLWPEIFKKSSSHEEKCRSILKALTKNILDKVPVAESIKTKRDNLVEEKEDDSDDQVGVPRDIERHKRKSISINIMNKSKSSSGKQQDSLGGQTVNAKSQPILNLRNLESVRDALETVKRKSAETAAQAVRDDREQKPQQSSNTNTGSWPVQNSFVDQQKEAAGRDMEVSVPTVSLASEQSISSQEDIHTIISKFSGASKEQGTDSEKTSDVTKLFQHLSDTIKGAASAPRVETKADASSPVFNLLQTLEQLYKQNKETKLDPAEKTKAKVLGVFSPSASASGSDTNRSCEQSDREEEIGCKSKSGGLLSQGLSQLVLSKLEEKIHSARLQRSPERKSRSKSPVGRDKYVKARSKSPLTVTRTSRSSSRSPSRQMVRASFPSWTDGARRSRSISPSRRIISRSISSPDHEEKFKSRSPPRHGKGTRSSSKSPLRQGLGSGSASKSPLRQDMGRGSGPTQMKFRGRGSESLSPPRQISGRRSESLSPRRKDRNTVSRSPSRSDRKFLSRSKPPLLKDRDTYKRSVSSERRSKTSLSRSRSPKRRIQYRSSRSPSSSHWDNSPREMNRRSRSRSRSPFERRRIYRRSPTPGAQRLRRDDQKSDPFYWFADKFAAGSSRRRSYSRSSSRSPGHSRRIDSDMDNVRKRFSRSRSRSRKCRSRSRESRSRSRKCRSRSRESRSCSRESRSRSRDSSSQSRRLISHKSYVHSRRQSSNWSRETSQDSRISTPRSLSISPDRKLTDNSPSIGAVSHSSIRKSGLSHHDMVDNDPDFQVTTKSQTLVKSRLQADRNHSNPDSDSEKIRGNPEKSGPQQSTSTDSAQISSSDDGKVYLRDVPMDVLSYAREKILREINSLNTDNDTELEHSSQQDLEPTEAAAEAGIVSNDAKIQHVDATDRYTSRQVEGVIDIEEGEISESAVDDGEESTILISDTTDMSDVCNTPKRNRGSKTKGNDKVEVSREKVKVVKSKMGKSLVIKSSAAEVTGNATEKSKSIVKVARDSEGDAMTSDGHSSNQEDPYRRTIGSKPKEVISVSSDSDNDHPFYWTEQKKKKFYVKSRRQINEAGADSRAGLSLNDKTKIHEAEKSKAADKNSLPDSDKMGAKDEKFPESEQSESKTDSETCSSLKHGEKLSSSEEPVAKSDKTCTNIKDDLNNSGLQEVTSRPTKKFCLPDGDLTIKIANHPKSLESEGDEDAVVADEEKTSRVIELKRQASKDQESESQGNNSKKKTLKNDSGKKRKRNSTEKKEDKKELPKSGPKPVDSSLCGISSSAETGEMSAHVKSFKNLKERSSRSPTRSSLSLSPGKQSSPRGDKNSPQYSRTSQRQHGSSPSRPRRDDSRSPCSTHSRDRSLSPRWRNRRRSSPYSRGRRWSPYTPPAFFRRYRRSSSVSRDSSPGHRRRQNRSPSSYYARRNRFSPSPVSRRSRSPGSRPYRRGRLSSRSRSPDHKRRRYESPARHDRYDSISQENMSRYASPPPSRYHRYDPVSPDRSPVDREYDARNYLPSRHASDYVWKDQPSRYSDDRPSNPHPIDVFYSVTQKKPMDPTMDLDYYTSKRKRLDDTQSRDWTERKEERDTRDQDSVRIGQEWSSLISHGEDKIEVIKPQNRRKRRRDVFSDGHAFVSGRIDDPLPSSSKHRASVNYSDMLHKHRTVRSEDVRQPGGEIQKITVKQLLTEQFGISFTDTIQDKLPYSLDFDLNSPQTSEEGRNRMMKETILACARELAIPDKPVATCRNELRSISFGSPPVEKRLEEFSDDDILLEVNVIKQCQIVLEHQQNGTTSSDNTVELLQEKTVRQMELLADIQKTKTQLGKRQPSAEQEEQLAKLKLELLEVQKEHTMLMKKCVEDKVKKAQEPGPTDAVCYKPGTFSGDELPTELTVSTSQFSFTVPKTPLPKSVAINIKDCLEKVAGEILELFKNTNFGRAHHRVPELLLLEEEKTELYSRGDVFLVLSSSLPKKVFVRLLVLRSMIEAVQCRTDIRASQKYNETQQLLQERSSLFNSHVGNINKKRVKKVMALYNQWQVCKDYLETVIGSEGVEMMPLFKSYFTALEWHLHILEEEEACPSLTEYYD